MLSKTLWVLDLAEPITDIHYHSSDSIDSVKRPTVLLLASPITASYYPTRRDGMLCSQGLEESGAGYKASHLCRTHHKRRSTRLSSTTLRIHGLSDKSRRKSGIQPLRAIRPLISGNHTQRVASPQNFLPPNLPETRLYLGTTMAALTLQILYRAHETAHWSRSLRLN